MKIAESNLNLSSSHVSVERHHRREQLSYWEDGREPVEMDSDEAATDLRRMASVLRAEHSSVEVNVSGAAASLQSRKALLKPDNMKEMDRNMADLKVSLPKILMEKLTGKEIRVFNPADMEPDTDKEQAREPEQATPEQAARAQQGEQRQGWGLVYDYYESHYEAESTQFSAEGVVRTADGKQITIKAELNMSREFFNEERLSIRAGDALKDPLVINFNGNAAQLTQREFSFDLDMDGRRDQIAFVRPGSGFLALDKNGNGKVDDGGELYGPGSGDGFAELASHDADGNNWIDANDPIYEQLRIWSKDAQGTDHLVGLGLLNVGAIYLGHADTPFAIKDESNELLGQVRSSGLYLEEDGGVGSVQQVDLKV